MRGCRSPPISPLTGVLHRLIVPRHPPTAHRVLPGLSVARQHIRHVLVWHHDNPVSWSPPSISVHA